MRDDDGEWLPAPRREATEPPVAAEGPGTHALTPWCVELVDGHIVVGGAEIHPAVARDLWARLGVLLGQAERDGAQAAYEDLAGELDRRFARGVPVRGRTDQRPRAVVAGVAVREGTGAAAVRLATYSVALLRWRGKRWEGPACEARPDGLGRCAFHPLGFRVIVEPEALARGEEAAPLALPGPAPSRAPARPPRVPSLPDAVARRRADIAELHEAILAAVGRLGDAAFLDELRRTLRVPSAELVSALGQLVEAGRLELHRGAGEWPDRWTLRERGDGWAHAPRAAARHATRLVRPPRRRRRGSKGSQPPSTHAADAAPPTAVMLACAPCQRIVKVPVEHASSALCRVCGGRMSNP